MPPVTEDGSKTMLLIWILFVRVVQFNMVRTFWQERFSGSPDGIRQHLSSLSSFFRQIQEYWRYSPHRQMRFIRWLGTCGFYAAEPMTASLCRNISRRYHLASTAVQCAAKVSTRGMVTSPRCQWVCWSGGQIPKLLRRFFKNISSPETSAAHHLWWPPTSTGTVKQRLPRVWCRGGSRLQCPYL
jgi:hypothetical protein